MQIEDIKTVEQAQALAYQQIKLLNQAQQNLQILEARITELGEGKPEKK